MNWTNVFRLPRPLAEAIMEDLYFGKREEGLKKYCQEKGLDRQAIIHFSVGELIKSPRQVLLARRHDADIIKDVAMEIFRILGTAVHYMLWAAAKRINERAGESYYRAEERLFYHFNVDGKIVVVSGEPDLVGPDDFIDDYKVTAVWSWYKGIKQEWEKQLNLYALFRTMAGKVTKGLRICYILRDWSVNETVQEGYPQAGAMTEPVNLWSFAEQEAFLRQRIHVHLAVRHEADDELPECSDEEMWAKEDAYAIKRQGNKVATKVISSKPYLKVDPLSGVEPTREEASELALKEAAALVTEKNGKLKGKEKDREYFLEHRPGERTRCLRFCDARQFCNQFKEYSSAAFQKDADPVEETV